MTPEQEARRARLLAQLAGPPPAPSSMAIPGFEQMPTTETADGGFMVGTPEPDIRMGGSALMPQTPDEAAAIQSELEGAGLIADLSGLGMLRDAGLNLSTAVEQGDPVRGAGAVGEAALTALPFTRLGRAMLSTLPRAVGSGLGAGLAVETAHGRGPLGAGEAAAQTKGTAQPSEAVTALQQQLKDAGFYGGAIDGIMGKGTQAAKAAFDASEERKGTADTDRLRAQAEAQKAAAEAKAAETAATESAGRATARAEGGRRLRELDEGLLSRGLNAAMTVGPYAGWALGGVLGHRLQRALTGRASDAARTVAANADAVMGQRVASNDIPGRVGRLNRFWSEGNPGLVEPFRPAPRSARGYVPNADAPTAAQLYQPTRRGAAAEALPVPAAGAIEHIGAEAGFSGPARDELRAANEAVAADPSEANIQRLQIARARAAGGELMSRVGFGMGTAGAGHTLLHSMVGAPRARPASIAQAERERGLLIRLLSSPPAKRRKKNG